MRISLVVPYQNIEMYIVPNLGLGYIASALRSKGHEVTYLDCFKQGVNESGWAKFLRAGQYDLIGIQMFTHTYHSARAMMKTAKKLFPNIISVIGGPHANALPEQLLSQCPEIDYVIHGEGEEAFPKLVETLEQGNLSRRISIPNLGWRDNNRVQVNDRSYIEDLDALSLPAWDLMDPRTYPALSHGLFNRAYPIAPIFATRGCPYFCTFCAASLNMGHRIRKRTPSKVVDEIDLLVKEYGVKEIHFEDDNFTFDKDFACEVCRIIIDRKTKISWACPNGLRIDSLDAELLKLMERSGCYSIAVGIESGSEKILKMVRKGITIEHVRQKLRLVSETTKIKITGFFMFGFPEENEDDFQKTENLIMNEPFHKISLAPCIPFPGTQMYKNLIENNQIKENKHWDQFSLYGNSIFASDQLQEQRLRRFMRKVHLKFYLRPKILIGIFSEIHSFGQVWAALRIFLYRLGLRRTKNISQGSSGQHKKELLK
ncbi:MAG: radical SAM protein [Candidatus Omnitrophota bacterium]